MIAWLTGTTLGKCIVTFFVSMLPIGELRLGLPYGVALGLPKALVLPVSILGNMVPVPFIIIYIRQIFAWLRSLDGLSGGGALESEAPQGGAGHLRRRRHRRAHHDGADHRLYPLLLRIRFCRKRIPPLPAIF